MLLLKIAISYILIVIVCTEKTRYDNYVLYKITPQNNAHLEVMKQLYEDATDLDFWVPPSEVGRYISVVASPEYRNQLEKVVVEHNIDAKITLDNVQRAIDDQINGKQKRSVRRELYWTNYQTLDEIHDWFDHLAETYPEVVTVVNVGRSYEGRNITGIKISRGSGRRSFFLEGGQVGADWLSPTVLTYVVDQLVRGDDPEAKAASEDFDWHIFPVVNPDGFEYSQDFVRLWAKNRRQVSATAVGVDMTKNWNSQWAVSGGSFTPTNDNYIGLGPFSEVETRSVSRYLESIEGGLTGVLSFRAFGQRLVIPFAHTTENEASQTMYNYREMLTIGRRAMGSLAVKYGTQYLVGTAKDVTDGATGAFADWAKHRFNPPIVATYHLRDTGTWGYTLPVVQVQPSCEETFDSLMAIIREAKFIGAI